MNKADLTLTEERIADGCYSRMAKTLNRRKFQISGMLTAPQQIHNNGGADEAGRSCRGLVLNILSEVFDQGIL